MKFAIANAAWSPDRDVLCKELTERVGNCVIFQSERREPAAVWARRIWEWASKIDDHVCVLNDDVTVIDNFPSVCRAMVEAVPNEVISLHCQAPDAVIEAQNGSHWARCYWLTGPGYILPPGAAKELLDWKAPWSYVSRINEDNVAIHWAWDNQKPIWNCIPAVICHRTEIPSTLGYDHHSFRVPSVHWDQYKDQDLTQKSFWEPDGEPNWIANPWAHQVRLEYVRRIHQAGRQLCFMCLEREGIIARKKGEPPICQYCLNNCVTSIARMVEANESKIITGSGGGKGTARKAVNILDP